MRPNADRRFDQSSSTWRSSTWHGGNKGEFSDAERDSPNMLVGLRPGVAIVKGLCLAILLLSAASIATAQSANFNEYPVPTSSGEPFDIAVGPDGALWFTEFYGNNIGRITTAGAITEYPIPTSSSAPQGITAGPDGALWFVEGGGVGKIGRITTAGVVTNEYPVPTSGSGPLGIVAGPDGALWFTEGVGNNIGRITTAGAITEYPIPTSFSAPEGIAVGPDGALWFTEANGNNIGQIATTGTITEFAIPTSKSLPVSIVAGPDGALWFTEDEGNNIGRVTTAGVVTNEFSLPTSGSGPSFIAQGPDGALWFTEVAGNRIGRITTGGTFNEYAIPTSNSVPEGIVTGPDGAIWFAEENGNKIGRLPFSPVPFINQPLVPDVATPGGSDFTLTLDGTGFVPNSVVNWALGTSTTTLSTTFVSDRQLTAAVPASLIATAGTASITATNSSPGGGTSNVILFAVTNPTTALAFANAPSSPVSVGSGPFSVVTGDFNGDGYSDLAIANDGDNSLTILLGNGDGTFRQAAGSPLTTGNGPVSVAVGDFNADGKLDLAVVNDTDSTVSIWLGNGDGTFTLKSTPSTGFDPNSVAVGDFNGDGHLDLAVVNDNSCAQGSVSILLGNGDGTFSAAPGNPPGTGVCPKTVAVGDFDKDGNLDLAVTNATDNTVSILLGNGDGTFRSQPAVGTGLDEPWGVTAADFNQDGNLDLAVTNLFGVNVSILLGEGNGGFAAAPGAAPSTGNGPTSVWVGDFNGDGSLDWAVTNDTDETVSILLGIGDGTFQPQQTFATGQDPLSVIVGDFNGDGRLDLAVVNRSSNSVSILLQAPAVTLTPIPLSFGNQPVGTPSTDPITVTNSGSANLNVTTAPTITGTNSGDFQIQNENCVSSSPIAPNSACTINVTFTPSLMSSESATLTVTDNSGDVAGSQQTVDLTGTGIQATTTTGVTSSANPSVYGQAVMFTATITPQGSFTPTGTVTFKDGTTAICTGVALASDQALCTISTLAAGLHSITAVYSGDTNFVGSTSPPLSQIVNPATLTITASSSTTAYGTAIPAVTPIYSGFINGDTAASLTTPPTCTTTGVPAGHPAGTYTGANTCSGAVDSNYTITYVPGNVQITPVPLTITASSGTFTYGGTVPTITPGYSGFVNGDTAASLTTAPTCSTTATSASPVSGSPYPSSCAGAVDSNYTIGYVKGSVTESAAVLTITASSGTFSYDAPVPTITAGYSGFVNGDTAANLTTPPTCSTTATSSSPVSGSPYPSTCSGAVDSNYTIGYVKGSVTESAAATSTAITSIAPNPSMVGQPVTVSYTVTVTAPGSGSIPGTDTVTVTDSTGANCKGTIAGGNCALVPTAVGADTLTATYSGDSNLTTSKSSASTSFSTVPTVSLTGLQATPAPTQPTSVGVTLNTPTPTPLTGTLTLSFQSSAAGTPAGYIDPGTQFAAGGTTLNFTIPAGAAVATLPQNGAIQQGTTAGTIIVTLTSLMSGTATVALPQPNPSLSVVVAPMAPVITVGTITGLTSTGFNVVLDAYSTSHDLASATFTFQPTSGAQLNGTTPSPVPLNGVAPNWFSGTGLQYGGNFELTVPFTFSGDTSALGSVTVTLTNSVGSSSSVTVAF